MDYAQFSRGMPVLLQPSAAFSPRRTRDFATRKPQSLQQFARHQQGEPTSARFCSISFSPLSLRLPSPFSKRLVMPEQNRYGAVRRHYVKRAHIRNHLIIRNPHHRSLKIHMDMLCAVYMAQALLCTDADECPEILLLKR